MEAGWPPFFDILRLYLRSFPGMHAATTRFSGDCAGSLDAAWTRLQEALGLPGAAVGDRRDTAAKGAPHLAGTVERISQSGHNLDLMLRLHQPAAGIALIVAYD